MAPLLNLRYESNSGAIDWPELHGLACWTADSVALEVVFPGSSRSRAAVQRNGRVIERHRSEAALNLKRAKFKSFRRAALAERILYRYFRCTDARYLDLANCCTP